MPLENLHLRITFNFVEQVVNRLVDDINHPLGYNFGIIRQK